MTRRSLVWLAIAGLAVYFVLFYSAEMPSLTQLTGKAFYRAQLLLHYLLLPEELAEFWFGTPAEFSLADRVPIVLLAAGILAWAIALGWLLLMLCRLDRVLTRLETLVFATAVGLNAISTYVLAVGLLGWLGRTALAAPAAVTFAAALWCWRKEKGDILNDFSRFREGEAPAEPCQDAGLPVSRAARQEPRPPRITQDYLVLPEKNRISPLLLGAIPFVAIIVLGAMLPPVEFDVREYHLQTPKEFYLQGRIGFLPHNVYGNMPMGTEMLSLLGMVIAGDWWLGALTGKTVIASYAVLTALGLLAAGRRFECRTAGAVAALVYISVPWVIQVSTLGLVDAALGCYLFLAFYAVCLAAGPLVQWERARVREHDERSSRSTEVLARQPTKLFTRQRTKQARKSLEQAAISPHPSPLPEGGTKQSSFLILAGYLAGGAVSCKYPGVLFVVLPLALWILIGFRDVALPWWRMAWKPATVFLLVAAVGCGLWFAKNWALAGNPTYPLLYSVFGGKTWTPEKDRQWNEVHRPHDFSLPTLGHDMARVALASEWLSPLVMPLAAMGLLVRPRRRLAIGLTAYFVFVIATWWLLTHRIDRFWIPALPLAAMLAGMGAVWSQERLWRIALLVVLILGAAANFLAASSVGGGYNRYFVSLARLRDDPERVDAWHRYLNRHAKQGRVLLVGDAQPFDLEMPVLYNTCFDDSIFEQLVKGRSPQEVRAALAEQSITHVYVHWGEIARYRRTYGFTEFVQPAVFEQLVSHGILAPLPEIPDHPGRGYRVVSLP